MIGTPFQQEVLTKLNRLGQTYIVGGAVRDAQLEIEYRDIDAVVALSLDELEVALSNWGYHPHRIGAKFQTISIFNNDERLDLTGFSGNLQEDALRRDFTINAIYFNVGTKQLEDPLSGISDLHSRVLKACGDARQRFAEDPIRVLRLVRLAAQLRLQVESKTWQEAIKALPGLAQTAPERITDEFSKILLLDDIVSGLNLLDDLGFFKLFLPELARLKGLVQNRYHTKDAWEHTLHVVSNTPPDLLLRLAGLFHDIGKWETASRECYARGRLEFCENSYRLGEFLVLGKNLERFKNKYVEVHGARLDNYPGTIQVKKLNSTVPGRKEFEWVPEGKRHFLGHERESGRLVEEILPRFRWSMFLDVPYSNAEAELVFLIGHHMSGTLTFMNELKGNYSPKSLKRKARKFTWELGWNGRSFSAERVENLLTLWRADFFGGKKRDFEDNQRFELIQLEIKEARSQIVERLEQLDWTILSSFAEQKGLVGERFGRFKEHLRRQLILNDQNINLDSIFLEQQYNLFVHQKGYSLGQY
ncbi:MAG: tRNA nucleotidyltransferase/poly(A) polymerase family protein [Desulfitobacteriaceae bacterium]